VTIDSQVRVPLETLSRDLEARLQSMFSRKAPAGSRRQRKGPPGEDNKIQGWTIEEGWDGEELVLPRGQFQSVVRVLQQYGYEVLVEREVSEGEALEGLTYQAKLRFYQKPAVEALKSKKQGQIEAGCGAGKTEIGIAGIAEVGRTALILVHTKDLMHQWQERVFSRLGIEAGKVGDGVRDIRPITIAMLQTLAGWNEPDLISFGRKFGVLICDECHHLPADLMSKAVNALPCRWRWGLTATPEREDGLNFVTDWVIGPIVYKVSQKELIDAGFLMPAEVFRVSSYLKVNWEDLSARYCLHRQAKMEELQAKAKLMVDRSTRITSVEMKKAGWPHVKAEELVRTIYAECIDSWEEPIEHFRLELTANAWPVDVDGICMRLAKKLSAYLKVNSDASSIFKALNHVSESSGRKHEGYFWDGDGPMPGWAMDALYWCVTTDAERNQLILQVVLSEIARGGTALVLSNRKAHCEEIARLVTEQGHRAEALTSEKDGEMRAETLDQLRDGTLRCAVATQLADEGLDVPRLTGIVLAAPSKAEGRTVQRLGRGMRPMPGKPTPRVYDVVDENVGVLGAQWWARVKAYRKVLGHQMRPKTWTPGQLELAAVKEA